MSEQKDPKKELGELHIQGKPVPNVEKAITTIMREAYSHYSGPPFSRAELAEAAKLKSQELALVEIPEAIELEHLKRQREEALKSALLLLTQITEVRDTLTTSNGLNHPAALKAYFSLDEIMKTINTLLLSLGGDR